MPTRIPIFHSILLKEGTWARAYLNELPLYKSMFFGPDSRSGPVNDLLVPGENLLSIELLKVKKLEHAPVLQGAIELMLYEVLNPDVPNPETTPIERRDIVKLSFPDCYELVAEQHRRLPFYCQLSFDPGVPLQRPPWLDAPECDFGCDGTPDLRDAVTRLHAALSENNVDDFLDQIALKLEHAERALEGEDSAKAKYKREGFRSELFKYHLQAQPLDFADLHFAPLNGGRVAHVSRIDGGFALEAVARDDPQRRLRTDLLLTQHDNHWRVFA